jgi:hypothetical protein
MPGGGFGIFDGCTTEWGTPAGGWGAQYGGISNRSQCDGFPAALRPGCYWRFDWFQDADNPTVTFEQVECPAALTAKSGCVRADDSIPETPTGSFVMPTWTPTTSSGSETGTTTSGGSTTTSTSTGAPGGDVPKYGQCGGEGWTGGTVCEAGSTCTYSNEYYSQCL